LSGIVLHRTKRNDKDLKVDGGPKRERTSARLGMLNPKRKGGVFRYKNGIVLGEEQGRRWETGQEKGNPKGPPGKRLHWGGYLTDVGP